MPRNIYDKTLHNTLTGISKTAPKNRADLWKKKPDKWEKMEFETKEHTDINKERNNN